MLIRMVRMNLNRKADDQTENNEVQAAEILHKAKKKQTEESGDNFAVGSSIQLSHKGNLILCYDKNIDHSSLIFPKHQNKDTMSGLEWD